jgi:hypothetical protein
MLISIFKPMTKPFYVENAGEQDEVTFFPRNKEKRRLMGIYIKYHGY